MSKQDELLKQAAEGELLLYVALRPFTAKLQPFGRTVKEPKQSFASEVTKPAGEYVPLNPVAAKGLCMFPDATVAWFEPEGSWEEGHPLHDHVYVLDEPQQVTRKQVRFEAVNSEGLDVFRNMKGLTASELTVRLLRKDGQPLPDSVEISTRGKKRTVSCNKIGLASDKGRLNREGQMLFALAHGTTPENIKSHAQAMKNLRKIFREKIGIMDKDPFMRVSGTWEPRFKLIDAIEQADKRKADRAIHEQYDDARHYDQENDAAGEWIQENDKKLPSQNVSQ